MIIRVQLFARARDLAGAEWIDIELAVAATVGDLRHALEIKFPTLGALLLRSAIAVDEDFAENSTYLSPGSKVAILPPVSGGS
ncbi:molybdopterin converting factor subunit 1 [soil metagenome]